MDCYCILDWVSFAKQDTAFKRHGLNTSNFLWWTKVQSVYRYYLLYLLFFWTQSHCAVTSHPVLWRVVGHVHDFLNGASFYVWIYQVSVNVPLRLVSLWFLGSLYRVHLHCINCGCMHERFHNFWVSFNCDSLTNTWFIESY